jgi:hypothetical protein
VSRLNTDAGAAVAHYVLLAVGAVWIVFCATGQWFFFDEWAFLVPTPAATDYLAPHVGHWSAAPMLITHALESVFGLGSYWPFLLPAIAVHLGIAHLLWRIARRAGVDRWIAVALALFFTVLGAGGENILWAFQIGFMGAVLLGLGAVLIADTVSPRHPVLAAVGFIVLTVVSLTFSGTALPLLLAAALVAWRRRGFVRAALLVVPAVFVYGSWYLFANRSYPMSGGGRVEGLGQLLTGVPNYAAKMFVDALQLITPVPGFGIVLFGVVLIAVLLRAGSFWRTRPMVIALVAAGLAFALLTGFSRINNGFDATLQGRYVYMVISMLVPLFGVVLTAAVRRFGAPVVLAVALVLAAAVYNAGLLKQDADAQSSREIHTQEILSAAAEVVGDPSLDIADDAKPAPIFAPDVTAADLRELVENGTFVPGAYSEPAYLTAVANLVPDAELSSDPQVCPVLPEGANTVASELELSVNDPTGIQLIARDDATATEGETRSLDLATGTTTLRLDDAFTWLILVPTGAAVGDCTAQ